MSGREGGGGGGGERDGQRYLDEPCESKGAEPVRDDVSSDVYGRYLCMYSYDLWPPDFDSFRQTVREDVYGASVSVTPNILRVDTSACTLCSIQVRNYKLSR
jgi:hypothetical protein